MPGTHGSMLVSKLCAWSARPVPQAAVPSGARQGAGPARWRGLGFERCLRCDGGHLSGGIRARPGQRLARVVVSARLPARRPVPSVTLLARRRAGRRRVAGAPSALPETLFGIATVAVMPLYGMMLGAPQFAVVRAYPIQSRLTAMCVSRVCALGAPDRVVPVSSLTMPQRSPVSAAEQTDDVLRDPLRGPGRAVRRRRVPVPAQRRRARGRRRFHSRRGQPRRRLTRGARRSDSQSRPRGGTSRRPFARPPPFKASLSLT